MPWCPKCKNEYYEGIKVCADCGTELTDELLQEKVTDESDFIPFEEYEEEEIQEDRQAYIDSVRESVNRPLYEDSAKKAKEFKSSAYMLLVVGALGLTAVVLMFAGVLNIALFQGPARYLSYTVMGLMFGGFFVSGIFSLFSAKRYEEKAGIEEKDKSELDSYLYASFTAESVDGQLQLEDLSEEERYFIRINFLREKCLEAHPGMDIAFVNARLDEFYSDIFENDI